MIFGKLFRNKSKAHRLWWMLFVSLSVFFKSSEADACRSIHGRLGTCVPLASCPLFYGWLKVRPLIRENLRLLVKYTCYFDIKNPKVCCPNDNLRHHQQEPEPIGVRLATPIRREVSSNAALSPNRLLFPEPHTPFPTTSPVGEKSHLHPIKIEDIKNIPSSLVEKRDHVPLSFPTEHFSHSTQNERGTYWNNPDKASKDAPIIRKDLRHHANFRLIPKLHECSNGLKLDSQIDGTYGAYPWLALVGFKRRRTLDFDHVCSGAIINDRYILTISSCFDRANPRFVRLGEYDLDTVIDQGSIYLPQSKREDYRIEKKTTHPHYNSTTGANNIALIRLEKPIPLNTTFIKSICLPFVTEYGLGKRLDINSDMDGKTGWVAGWSHHSIDGVYTTGSDSRILEEGLVDITSHEKCRQDYPNVLSAFSSRTQLCVGGKGRRNSCVPDSGGPLMYPTKVPSKVEGYMEAKFFMLGLHSRGPTGTVCQTVSDIADEDERKVASLGLPTSVFTKVSKYLEWILDNMQE